MKVKQLETDVALDILVTNWIQRMENIHPRCISKVLFDEKTGDEFMTVYDPASDECLTVWKSPSRFGNEVLEMARGILSSIDHTKGGRQ
jgi:hypothetical protein